MNCVLLPRTQSSGAVSVPVRATARGVRVAVRPREAQAAHVRRRARPQPLPRGGPPVGHVHGRAAVDVLDVLPRVKLVIFSQEHASREVECAVVDAVHEALPAPSAGVDFRVNAVRHLMRMQSDDVNILVQCGQ